MNEWKPVQNGTRPAEVADDDDVQIHLHGETSTHIEQGSAVFWEGVAAYRVIDAAPPSFDSKPTNPKDALATNKLPLHLVSPIVKAYQALAHYLGNVKYGAWNYRGAGIRNSVYKAAAERHLDAWWEGEELDPTDGTPHLANALACVNILIEGKYTPSTVDDRPPSRAEALAAVRAELEALMPKIRERYAHLNPRHFTIEDRA